MEIVICKYIKRRLGALKTDFHTTFGKDGYLYLRKKTSVQIIYLKKKKWCLDFKTSGNLKHDVIVVQ